MRLLVSNVSPVTSASLTALRALGLWAPRGLTPRGRRLYRCYTAVSFSLQLLMRLLVSNVSPVTSASLTALRALGLWAPRGLTPRGRRLYRCYTAVSFSLQLLMRLLVSNVSPVTSASLTALRALGLWAPRGLTPRGRRLYRCYTAVSFSLQLLMRFLVSNVSPVTSASLTALRALGLWAPRGLTPRGRRLYRCYTAVSFSLQLLMRLLVSNVSPVTSASLTALGALGLWAPRGLTPRGRRLYRCYTAVSFSLQLLMRLLVSNVSPVTSASLTALRALGLWAPRGLTPRGRRLYRCYTAVSFSLQLLMRLLVSNVSPVTSASLTALRALGLWAPRGLTPRGRRLYRCYTAVSFMVLLGIFILTQVVELFLEWGDLQRMTAIAFVLLTNMAQAAKIVNLLLRRDRIERIIVEADRTLREAEGSGSVECEIVQSCNRETLYLFIFYVFLTNFTVTGWAVSAEKNQLPLRGWYPYDTTSHPSFELTYLHQVVALFLVANLNVAKDLLLVTMVAQTRCRLRLLREALADLHHGMETGDDSPITPDQEREASRRLRSCVSDHQAALAAVKEVQSCFSEPTAAQFAVSMLIICVTAFQLATLTMNPVRLLSMGTYLMDMVFQVFLYCHQGNSLQEESMSVSEGAYSCRWLSSRARLRRSLLLVAARAQRPAAVRVGGLVALALPTFMAIIKTSYSFFTLLLRVEEAN